MVWMFGRVPIYTPLQMSFFCCWRWNPKSSACQASTPQMSYIPWLMNILSTVFLSAKNFQRMWKTIPYLVLLFQVLFWDSWLWWLALFINLISRIAGGKGLWACLWGWWEETSVWLGSWTINMKKELSWSIALCFLIKMTGCFQLL